MIVGFMDFEAYPYVASWVVEIAALGLAVSIRMPKIAKRMDTSGFSRLKKQYGMKLVAVIPRVAAMYAPQLFQGMSGEVTVPESPSARDRTTGAIP